MPKIVCRCGVWLRYGDIPNPIEWLIISDTEFDKFSGLVDAEDIYIAMNSLLKCPNCGRLWVFENGFDSDPQVYAPE